MFGIVLHPLCLSGSVLTVTTINMGGGIHFYLIHINQSINQSINHQFI